MGLMLVHHNSFFVLRWRTTTSLWKQSFSNLDLLYRQLGGLDWESIDLSRSLVGSIVVRVRGKVYFVRNYRLETPRARLIIVVRHSVLCAINFLPQLVFRVLNYSFGGQLSNLSIVRDLG